MSYFKLIPAWLWVALGLLVGGWFYGRYQYNEGQEAKQDEWNAAIERGKAEVARLKAEAGKITVQTEIKYVEREKRIYEKGETITKYVDRFIPDDSCEFAPGFRVYHDAAAENRIPDSSEIANAAPVQAKEVAATIAENYTGCNANAAKIEEWQNWAREQCSLNEKGCPDGSE